MGSHCHSNLSQYNWHRVMPSGDKHEGGRRTALARTLPRARRHDSLISNIVVSSLADH